MHTLLPYLAGIACSLCYGIATVLQQIAAKKQQHIDSLHPTHLIRLLQQGPYILGIVLDIVGWILFLIAARTLPLFLSLAFVALGLVVTAIIAQIFLSIKSSRKEKFAMTMVGLGIVLLGVIAQPSTANKVNHIFLLTLEIIPLPLALIGLLLLKSKNIRYAPPMLAAMAGITFGATGLISRIINLSSFSFREIFHVIVLSLLTYGVLGAIFLAAALQRDSVNKVNSILYSSELIIPSLLGIMFLNDRAKHGLWPLMIISFLCVVLSTIIASLETQVEVENETSKLI